jgi:hypothetical protein
MVFDKVDFPDELVRAHDRGELAMSSPRGFLMALRGHCHCATAQRNHYIICAFYNQFVSIPSKQLS